MIVSQLVPKQGICSIIVEAPDDLWTLRRLISPGDTIVSKSSRVQKKEEEYSRPDKGERVKVTVALVVEDVSLDSGVGRLRVRGRITEASDESISRAGTHSISISPGFGLTLRKEHWGALHTAVLNSAKDVGRRFLVVAVDRREAGVGLLSGSHLSILATVESGASGKGAKEVDSQPFMRKVTDVLKNSWANGDVVVLAGPGHTKLALANHLSSAGGLGSQAVVVEGFDLSGADGVRGLIKFDGFRAVARDSRLVEVQGIVDEVIRRIARGEGKVAYGLARVKAAAEVGAVESCVVSDDVFSMKVSEAEVVFVLNEVEEKGGRVFLCDASLETGKQVSSFGGIIATLRYTIRA